MLVDLQHTKKVVVVISIQRKYIHFQTLSHLSKNYDIRANQQRSYLLEKNMYCFDFDVISLDIDRSRHHRHFNS